MKNINPKVKEIIEWLYCILIAVVLALFVRYFIGTPTKVQQPSMYPTLQENQRLILNRFSRTIKSEIKRGEIITFESPSDIHVSSYDADFDNPVAKYENEPKGIFSKLGYYVLEIGKTSYIKRVIGVEGDTIEIKEGKVYLNGEEYKEPYLQEGISTSSLNGPYTKLTVPKGTVFVMGDNRPHSTDSRRFGCIPIEKVESKVLIRFWPFNLFGKVE